MLDGGEKEVFPRNGLALLHEIAAASSAPASSGGRQGEARPFEVLKDPGSGQAYLKLRMPDPDTVQRAVEAIGALRKGVGG